MVIDEVGCGRYKKEKERKESSPPLPSLPFRYVRLARALSVVPFGGSGWPSWPFVFDLTTTAGGRLYFSAVMLPVLFTSSACDFLFIVVAVRLLAYPLPSLAVSLFSA